MTQTTVARLEWTRTDLQYRCPECGAECWVEQAREYPQQLTPYLRVPAHRDPRDGAALDPDQCPSLTTWLRLTPSPVP